MTPTPRGRSLPVVTGVKPDHGPNEAGQVRRPFGREQHTYFLLKHK